MMNVRKLASIITKPNTRFLLIRAISIKQFPELFCFCAGDQRKLFILVTVASQAV